jgi:hypothetical protein
MKSNYTFDSEEWRKERDQLLVGWMAGNPEAIEVVHVLGQVCETWDDLVDKDREVTEEIINRTFTGVFVKLVTNSFWQRGRLFIEPVFIVAINAWMDANELAESDDERYRMLAFHIRNYSTEMAMCCAFLAGGWEHLRKVSNEMREYFSHESYSEWELRK